MVDAAQAVQAANASGDAQQIRAALQALEAAKHAQQAHTDAAAAPAAASEVAPAAAKPSTDSRTRMPPDQKANYSTTHRPQERIALFCTRACASFHLFRDSVDFEIWNLG